MASQPQPSPSSSPAAPANTDSRLRERVRSLQLTAVEERRTLPWRWITLAVILLVGGLIAWSFSEPSGKQRTASKADGSSASSEEKGDSESASGKTSSGSQTSTQATSTGSRAGIVLESPGYITPAHRILVSPKVSGMLMELNIEEGMRIKQGDTIGVIESIEYAADAKRAKAMLEIATQKWKELDQGMRPEEILQAEAELAEAEARKVQLLKEFDRSAKLAISGGVSQSELDELRASRDAQLRRIDRLKLAVELMNQGARKERRDLALAEIDQAEADYEKAKWRLDNCTIRSPISGTILKKNAEEGNIVNPIAFNGSFSVCEMADLADLEVDLTIQERDIAKVFKGQRCKVRANAYQDRVYDGYVDRLMPIADRAEGAVPVRVKVKVPAEEEGIYLKPDMSALVTFYAKEDVPATAASP